MEHLKIINLMRIMKPVLEVRLDLSDLHRALGGKLYPGRPHMLVVRMGNGRNIQIFQGGCIQILGRITDAEAEGMRQDLIGRLSQNVVNNTMCRELYKQVQTSPFRIANIVLHAHLRKQMCLRRIAQSNDSHFYEIEIFPAALIRKWSPAHIALFHNGNVIITGVKSVSQCQYLLSSLQHYLSTI